MITTVLLHAWLQVVKSSRVLFLMVLPSQLSRLAAELRKQLRRRCCVVSFLIGVPEEKLLSVFQSNTVVIRARAVSVSGIGWLAVIDAK